MVTKFIDREIVKFKFLPNMFYFIGEKKLPKTLVDDIEKCIYKQINIVGEDLNIYIKEEYD